MRVKKGLLLSLFCGTLSAVSIAQTPVQTIRGTVVDKISQAPLAGATVILVNSVPQNVTSTDAEGKFKLNKVPVGKQSLKIILMGYQELRLQDMSVNAGKELVLTLQMEEDIKAIDEVVVKVAKNKPLNEYSTVSTRTFSVEETQRFAAAVNDPARMALSFAGVVQVGDGNNFIAIRGNSPNGLLWRMEGVEIPNPNHFSNVGTSGGGISIISSQLLGNSDFSTGAFASEYGNALSGVFDLKLRKGNNEKREYTFQVGVLGTDVAAEGPFKKGYGGSYLINYRYSTLNILSKIGVPIGDGVTNFQDLSFNVSLPTKKAGTFGFFGFAGNSYQILKARKDSASWAEDEFYRYNSDFRANTGAAGLTHTRLFNNGSYLRTALVFSGTENSSEEDKMQDDMTTLTREYEAKFLQRKITLSSTFTKKINARNNLRTGLILNQPAFDLLKKSQDDSDVLQTRINQRGYTYTSQLFFQWNHKLNARLSTNLGLHYLHLFLNNTYSVEPRASVRYEISTKHTVALGYGMHSQLQPLGVYFTETPAPDGSMVKPNKDLGLSKAHHLVLSYDWNINSFSHIKTEMYYQYLFNVPISNDRTNTYSMLNQFDGYYTDTLVNKGLGRNYGMELTYERFLYRNLYYLVSGSLYDSRYRAANNNWYNTFFNTRYALTISVGKEWLMAGRTKTRVLGLNLKSVYVGGFRDTPIDLQASIAAGETVYDNTRTFKEQSPAYYRLDIRVSLKRNYKKLTSTLAFDVQNVTNRQNVGGKYFDSKTGTVKYWYQAPLIPILSYRLEF